MLAPKVPLVFGETDAGLQSEEQDTCHPTHPQKPLTGNHGILVSQLLKVQNRSKA
jgi:hypothetical protein